MIRLIALTLIMFFIFSFNGCVKPITTENPTNPEADDPIIEGEEVVAPIGCIFWQVNDPDADC